MPTDRQQLDAVPNLRVRHRKLEKEIAAINDAVARGKHPRSWADEEIKTKRAKFYEDERAAVFDVWLDDIQRRNALKATLPSQAEDRGAAVRKIATDLRTRFEKDAPGKLPNAADLANLSAVERR